MGRWICPALLLAMLLLPFPTLAQQESAVLVLSVVDRDSGRPLPSASIRVRGSSLTALSDRAGRAQLAGMKPGRQVVEVALLGYAPGILAVELEPGDSVRAQVQLLVQPIALAAVRVVGRQRRDPLAGTGFHERQREGGGIFVSRDEIEKRRARILTDILRGVGGIRIVPGPAGNLATTSRGGPILNRDPVSGRTINVCPLQLFIDGKVYPSRSVDEVPLDWVEAIEVYRGPAATPPLYKSTGESCGAILIWTR